MSRMSREEFERQAVLYAMGALSPEEAGRFEAERAQRGAAGERLEHGVRRAIGRAAGGPEGVAPSERAALAAVTARPARRAPWGWIAVSVVLLLAGGAALLWGLDQRARAEEEAARAAGLQRSADSLRAALGRSKQALAAQPPAAELARLLAAPELIVVPLAGISGAEGRIMAAAGRGALLVAGGLAPQPEGGSYQLWREAGDSLELISLLGDAPRGYLFALFSDAGFLTGARTLRITTGPPPAPDVAGGAMLAPTENVILEGRPPQ